MELWLEKLRAVFSRGGKRGRKKQKNRKRKLEDHGNSPGDRNVSSEFETSQMVCISFLRSRNGNFVSVTEVESRESSEYFS